MAATLILWFVYAVFLKVAIGIATSVDARVNTLGRAMVTAAVLSLGQGLLAAFGGVLLLMWPFAWLFIIKRSYEIGWLRAILVWLALVLMAIGLVLAVLVPLGMTAAVGALVSMPW